MFWIIALMLTLVAVLYVLAPLLRGAEARAERSDTAVYKAQLAELDRDRDRGLIDATEAEEARTEIARRLLAAARRSDGSSATRGGLFWPAVTAAVLVAATGAAYLTLGAPGLPDQPLAARLAAADAARADRPDQAALEAAAPALPPVEAPAEYLEAVAQLRLIAPTRPDDLQAWSLLARHEASLQNYAAAAAAQGRVLDLRGTDATLAEQALHLDLLAFATDGVISPQAETRARAILAQDETNPTALFHLGALYAQTGRPDLALSLWRPLVEGGPEGFHKSLARDQIARVAAEAGVDYTPPPVQGPSLADIAAAQDLSAEDRAAMIAGMVGRLSDRLATQGGPAADWARLIRAMAVMGDTQGAAEVLAEARSVFGADPASVAVLDAAAAEAGLP